MDYLKEIFSFMSDLNNYKLKLKVHKKHKINFFR